jgi:hypothetical protein
MKPNIHLLLFVVAVGVGACHQKDDDPIDMKRLREGCEAWCEVAVPCSVHYAGPGWGNFSTQAECEEACTSDVEFKVEFYEGCFDLILDDRECAAALSCDEFRDYENWAFGEPSAYPFPCVEEQEALEQTNCY